MWVLAFSAVAVLARLAGSWPVAAGQNEHAAVVGRSDLR